MAVEASEDDLQADHPEETEAAERAEPPQSPLPLPTGPNPVATAALGGFAAGLAGGYGGGSAFSKQLPSFRRVKRALFPRAAGG